MEKPVPNGIPPAFDSRLRLGLTEVPSRETDLQLTSPTAPLPGITGPTSEYIILVSSDFHEFVIKRAAAYMSPTIRRTLESRSKALKPWNVSEVLVNYPSMIVAKVAEYLDYKEYYERLHQPAPKFVVEPQIVLEVLMAAQFLDI